MTRESVQIYLTTTVVFYQALLKQKVHHFSFSLTKTFFVQFRNLNRDMVMGEVEKDFVSDETFSKDFGETNVMLEVRQ